MEGMSLQELKASQRATRGNVTFYGPRAVSKRGVRGDVIETKNAELAVFHQKQLNLINAEIARRG
jgi:hypothetical protein